MATSIHSSLSCLLPSLYSLFLNRKIFHLFVYIHVYMHCVRRCREVSDISCVQLLYNTRQAGLHSLTTNLDYLTLSPHICNIVQHTCTCIVSVKKTFPLLFTVYPFRFTLEHAKRNGNRRTEVTVFPFTEWYCKRFF